jgi:predicted transcriptional regulator
MIKIGDVCPLFFNPIKDKFGLDIDYIQKFHSSDKIHIQIFSSNSESVSATLNNLSKNTYSDLVFSEYKQNDSVMMSYTVITGLDDSVYTVTVNGLESEPFIVCSSDFLLEETALIRYSHKDNNSAFDNIFWIENQQQVFEFRVEAGFKPNGYNAHVENEQYRNQMQEIENLYSIPYDSFIFTVGNSAGVPYWFAKHFNRILCLSMVEIDNVKYVRSEDSTPELSQVMEDSQLFQISVALEPQENDIAGIGGRPESGSSSSVVGFVINNPKDGEMLQYSENEDAFVNVDYVGV